MANFFLDTSALAKLYHAEAGSDYVEHLLQQPGNRLLISRLCLVEMESVFAIKVRSGDLNSTSALDPFGAQSHRFLPIAEG